MTPTGVLAYHTALEVYGVSYTSNKVEVQICTPHGHRFRPFTYLEYTFSSHELRGMTGVTTIPYFGTKVRITSHERTFIDCLDRPDLCGGWGEVMRSIDVIELYDPELLFQILRERNKQRLIRNVGFAIEAIQHDLESILKLKDCDYVISEFLKMVRGPPQPLEWRPHPLIGPTRLNPKWKLYVHSIL